MGRTCVLFSSLLLLGCTDAADGADTTAPATTLPLEVKRALLRFEPPVRSVLAEALAAHGWLDESATIAVVKRTRLLTADATLDTCYAEAYALRRAGSTVRPVPAGDCDAAFAIPESPSRSAARPLAGEAYKRAHFTATLPWRLLDAGTSLTRRPDTVIAALNHHLGRAEGLAVRQLLARYPPDDEGDPTAHFFDAGTGRHLGYLVRHPGGDALVLNDGRDAASGPSPVTHRTTLRLDESGAVAYVRAEFTYRYPDGLRLTRIDRAELASRKAPLGR